MTTLIADRFELARAFYAKHHAAYPRKPASGQSSLFADPEFETLHPRDDDGTFAVKPEGVDSSSKRLDEFSDEAWTGRTTPVTFKPHSEMDDSYDEAEDNLSRVTQDPEKANDKDLGRAIGRLSHQQAAYVAIGRHDRAKAVGDDMEWFRRILSQREKAANWPTAAESKAMAPAFDSLFAAYRQQKYGTEEPQKYSRAEFASAIDKLIDRYHTAGQSDISRRMGLGPSSHDAIRAAEAAHQRRFESAKSRHEAAGKDEHFKTSPNPKRLPGDGTAGWQKVGGSSVYVDGNGRIVKGCAGLKGEHVSNLIDEEDESRHHREVRQAHAEARGLSGRDLTPQQAKRLATKPLIEQHDAAKSAAKQHGASKVDVLRSMPDATEMQRAIGDQTEAARRTAAKMTGLTPAKIGRIENAYRDHSTVFDFDTHARELAGMHPELGFDPEDQDTPAKAWELLKAGKIKKVSLEQIAQFAADMVAKELRPKPLKQVVLGEADDSFGGHGGFDPDKFSRLESAVMRYSGQRGLFDEEDHPRASKGGAKGGQFIAIHSGHTVEGGPVHVGESSRQHGEWVYSHEVSSMTPEHRAAYTESLAGRKPERTYRNADGSPLPPSVAEEIKALKIRPDLKDVRLVRNEHGELKGSGKDSKGRSQPIYPSAHRARKDAEKFERIRQFTKQIGDIRKRVEADLQSPDAAKREAAFLAYLIDKTGMRIGSDKDTGAEKEATGATTLEAKHVHIDGDHVTMDFVGKSGHDNHWEVNDPLIASELAKRMPSGKERLFSVNDAQFRKYMNGVAPGFKPAKDFRTAVAADHAMKAIATMPVPKTAVEYRNALGQVAESVSSRINNTPDVAFKSYIPPEVFGAWQANLLSNGIDVTALKPSYPKAMSIPVPMKSSPPKTRAGGMTTTMKMIPKTTEGYSRLETARAAASVHRYGGPAATADPICRARDRPPSVRGSARSG